MTSVQGEGAGFQDNVRRERVTVISARCEGTKHARMRDAVDVQFSMDTVSSISRLTGLYSTRIHSRPFEGTALWAGRVSQRGRGDHHGTTDASPWADRPCQRAMGLFSPAQYGVVE